MAADDMKILGGSFSDNDQLGIGGNAATGVVLDGLDGDQATFDGPELARNHTLHESCDWEAGGMKWDVGRVTIRNARVHDNDCKGLWADINARGALIERNLIENNRDEGIFYEISQDAVIRNNHVYGNGLGGNGWYWAGGITVASSFNVEVYGNRLSGNYNGITGTQQNRTDSTPPAHLLDDLRRPRQRDLRHWRRSPGHRRDRRQRGQPRRARHQLQPQHGPVGSVQDGLVVGSAAASQDSARRHPDRPTSPDCRSAMTVHCRSWGLPGSPSADGTQHRGPRQPCDPGPEPIDWPGQRTASSTSFGRNVRFHESNTYQLPSPNAEVFAWQGNGVGPVNLAGAIRLGCFVHLPTG